ncbi:MAG: septal ring lytic transglycosylase RlpA family protein [Phaeodactylibacter sp.]|nr:septal ring lytic transglycosylase RlpA family protein [Phaeodactylibacter sp.]MCB9049835.1 septal ring lytic transglycosylase RlpA family protein [Lewinellaceae bacterium]
MSSKFTLAFLSLCMLGLTTHAQYGNSQYEEGIAVYYADDLHGQATSYGEQYQREAFTAAHQYYPPGTILRVTRLDNGQSVQVRVNDKMAPDGQRKIILSRAAAMQIGLITAGTLRVRIEKTSGGEGLPTDYAGKPNSGYFSAGTNSNTLTARSGYPDAYRVPAEPRQQASGSYYPSGTTNTAYRSNRQPESYENTLSYRSPAASVPSADAVRSSGKALAPGLTGYVIQLASYDDGANAVNYLNQLLKQGLQHIYIWQKDGKNRVVVARFQDKAAASDYLNTLRQQYLLDGIVIQLK